MTLGIICSLTSCKEKNPLLYVIEAFIYGTFSYLLLSLFTTVKFIDCIFDEKISIDVREIFWASICGVCIGLFLTYIYTHEFLYRFARKINLTKKFAENDVWSHIFNSPDISESWILVRDQSKNLMYEGWVEHFSDVAGKKELFMRDVMVYRNSSSKYLYEIDGLYISEGDDKFAIEIRELVDSKNIGKSNFSKGSEKNE